MNPSIPAPEPSGTIVVPLRGRGASEVTAAAVDLDDLNSPHTLAVLSVSPGAAVLDVGCGPGVVTRALAARGCRVWGIEIDARKAALARAHCVEVIEADIESVSLPSVFDGLHFDTVLCLDVLEHLREPAAVLARLKSVLAPGGSILISVPNVTHGALRLELLKGKFAYRNSGLLDRGHLRFFDTDALRDLIRQAGLRAETMLRVVKRLDQTEFDVDLDSIPGELRSALEKDVDALTYQFFVVARPVRDGQLKSDGASLAERLRARLDLVAAELEKAGTYARHLEAELKAKDEHLQHAASERTHIEELTAELQKATAYARGLEAELAAATSGLRERGTALQAATAHGRLVEAELTASRAKAGEMSGIAEELRRELEASGARSVALERNERDLRRILDDTAAYVRHLEGELQKRVGDIAIRDDEMSVLRAHIEKTERAIAERDGQVHAIGSTLAGVETELQQRLGDLARRDADLRSAHGRIQEIERITAGREATLRRTASELEDARIQVDGARARVAELSGLVQQHRDRLSAIGADAFVTRAPRLHRLFRPALAAIVRRWRPPTPPR